MIAKTKGPARGRSRAEEGGQGAPIPFVPFDGSHPSCNPLDPPTFQTSCKAGHLFSSNPIYAFAFSLSLSLSLAILAMHFPSPSLLLLGLVLPSIASASISQDHPNDPSRPRGPLTYSTPRLERRVVRANSAAHSRRAGAGSPSLPELYQQMQALQAAIEDKKKGIETPVAATPKSSSSLASNSTTYVASSNQTANANTTLPFVSLGTANSSSLPHPMAAIATANKTITIANGTMPSANATASLAVFAAASAPASASSVVRAATSAISASSTVSKITASSTLVASTTSSSAAASPSATANATLPSSSGDKAVFVHVCARPLMFHF